VVASPEMLSREAHSNDTVSAFFRGVAAGQDPATAAALQGGRADTNLRSPWLQRRCVRCGHTFRLKDVVEPHPTGGFVHAAGTVICSEPGAPAPAADALREAFQAGVRSGSPPPPDLPVVSLGPGHPLLDPPTPAFRRKACSICGHTFRPGDQVVICPCNPDQPVGGCAAGVHRDPVRQLFCWDEWSRSKIGGYCPVTSRKLP